VAVVSVAMLTAIVNCGAMAITVTSIGLGKQLFGERGLTAELAIEFCGLLLLFAAFFSAVLLALTSFARSFKEAQAYLVPLMLASTAPGIFTMINGVRLTPLLAVAPLANIVLLARDMFEYNASPGLSLLVLGSTLVYALIAIFIAAKLFGSDAVLYGSPGSWSETFHPQKQDRDAASLGTALLTLAVLSPFLLLLSNLIARQNTSVGMRMGLSACVTFVLFAGVPMAVERWVGVKLLQGLSLRLPSAQAFFAAILLGVSLWPFAHEIFVLQNEHGWISLDAEKIQRVQDLLAAWQQIPLPVILFCAAVAPALAEEIFFRGFLLRALRTRQSELLAIVTSATIFGLFHVIVMEGMLFDRFLPTTFLGLILGWLAIRTGSIWPGVLLHGTHNGLLLVVARYRDELAQRGWGVEEAAHLPTSWLVGAGVVAVIGILIARTCKPPPSPNVVASPTV
jgi:sodium transport system permease protein